MSKFKVEFTLKQHTPIIHFQSDQNEATLRVTELKPKFDKFLKKYAFGDNRQKYEDYLIKGQEAFDYKVNISSSVQEKSLPNSFLYFANNAIKDDSEKIKMVKSLSLNVSFFSYKTHLIEIIGKYFNDFLLITNFGTRQSKGYGSFSSNTDNVEDLLKQYYPFVFKISHVENIAKWEDKVDNIHKRLKSGINFKSYYKSLLFQYMCTKKIRWEKRKIKEEFPDVATGNPPIDCNTKGDYRYIRAMLGLAGINEYKVGRDKFVVTINGNEIERFKSPITYKVISNDIYLCCDKSYEAIMGKSFEFTLRRGSFDLKTPSKKEFDLYEFLKFVEKQENLISEVTRIPS